MKESKYNFFFDFKEIGEKKLAYNALTNSLALVDLDHFKKYDDFINSNTPILDDKFIEDLKSGGFLIQDDLDELKLLRLQLFQSRYNPSFLGLTLAVTEDCNFRCVYCYEKNSIRSAKMTSEVQEGIIRFIEEQAEKLSVLSITWYGGEPLLALDVIRNLSEQINNICNDKNITYYSFLVTNGYLLNRSIAMELKEELHIQGLQITLDGPELIHNQRRPLLGGQETFNKILENLKENIDILPPVSIRINTDKENKDKVNEVFQILKNNELADKVDIYLGYVEALNDGYVTCKCMTPEGFSKAYYEFMKANNLDIKQLYPKRFTNYCGADAINAYVVGADGRIYKCWNDIGMEDKCIGEIPLSGIEKNIELYMNYLLYDPTQDNRCIECKLLPVCMGGCPNRRLLSMENCSHTKYVLEEYLKACAQSIIEERKG